jgi:thiol-disulfide isomerase/thioredoxin
MRYLLSNLLLFLGLPYAIAQGYSLQAKVDGFAGTRAYLVKFNADQQSVADSSSSLDGAFTFRFGEKFQPGIYRIILGEAESRNLYGQDPQFFDFIFNKENINLKTSYGAPVRDMQVTESAENILYYRFLKANDLFQARMNRLTPLFTMYGPDQEFYQAAFKEFLNIQNTFTQQAVEMENEMPGSIASAAIQVSVLPVVDNPVSSREMRLFLRDHYFDLISFTDDRLINSPLVSKVILDYLSLYNDPAFDQAQQEASFILAVDNIMESVTGNPVFYDFILNFLVNGFQRFQMETVLVHIAETYVEGGCETDSKELLIKRLEGYEKMAPGKKAPDILMFDIHGKQSRLYDLTNEYTLVVFWASWCPHCSAFLKQLATWYPGKKVDLEVYAVSIDSSRITWENRCITDNYPWINTFSGAGWDGKAPKDYNVYATPTLFLLDREHRIIAKPLTFKEFKKEIDGLKKQ